jgi:hypothetical protein
MEKLYATLDEKFAKGEKSTLMEFFSLINVQESKEFNMDVYIKMMRYLNNHALFANRSLVIDVLGILSPMFRKKMTEDQKKFLDGSNIMKSIFAETEIRSFQEGRQLTLLELIAKHLAKGTPREKLTDILCVTENELEKLLKLHDIGYGNGGNKSSWMGVTS